DWSVTGVQTCALPIWARASLARELSGFSLGQPELRANGGGGSVGRHANWRRQAGSDQRAADGRRAFCAARRAAVAGAYAAIRRQIGRASCRERGERAE